MSTDGAAWGLEANADDDVAKRRERAGKVLADAEAAAATGRFAEAASLLESDLMSVAGWYLDRFRALIDALPDEIVRASPTLSLAQRGAANFVDQDQPLAAMDAAQVFAELGTSGNALADEVLVGLGRIFALRSVRDYAGGIAVVERGRARVDSVRPEWLEVPGEIRSIVLLQWGLTRMLVKDLAGATKEFQESFWAGRRSTMPHFARNGAEDAALMLALVDSVEDAEEWLAKARTIELPPEHLRKIVEVWDPLVEATVHMARLELDDARKALERFRPAPDTNLGWAIEAYLRARLGLLDGENFGALDEIMRVSHPRGGEADRGSLDEALLAIAEAELSVAVGRAPRAEVLLERLPPGGPLVAAARARTTLAKGDAAGALVQALAGLHEATPFGRIDLAVIAAVAQLRQGRRDEAAAQFARALELVRGGGVVAPFALVPRADLEALVELVPSSAEPLARVLSTPRGPDTAPVASAELSERERLVLVELAGTSSLPEIASRLFVSVNTVKTQVRSIYRKLGVHSREAALEAAHQRGYDLG